jgi:Putative transposase
MSNPKRLGAEIGFLGVLHTWGQTLMHHPHIHCVVPAGGFAPGRTAWIRPKCTGFFLPVRVLSQVFRGRFTEGLKQLYRTRKLEFHGSLAWLGESRSFARFVRELHRQDWVVYAKKPFGGPEHVLQYLAGYTHRVAISNHRLLGMEDGKVTFRWRDYAHGRKQRKMTLAAEEFIRRFLLHLLPKGLVRIRYYGWMANRRRHKCVALCRELLRAETETSLPTDKPPGTVRRCPKCGGEIATVETIVPRELSRRRPGRTREPNSS